MSLVIRELRVARGTFSLGPVDIHLSAGVSALVGPNGAGKTTLIEAAAGLVRTTSGTSSISDHE
jgi:ABC-type multidrug transport system ATPase subunit